MNFAFFPSIQSFNVKKLLFFFGFPRQPKWVDKGSFVESREVFVHMKESTGKKQKRKQAPNKKSKNLVISFVFFFLRFSFQARKAGSLSKSPPMLHRGGDHRLPKRIGRVQSDHLRTGGPMRWMTRWWQLKHQQPLERAMFSQIPKRSRLESPEKTVEKIRGYVNFTGVYWLIDLIHVLNKKHTSSNLLLQKLPPSIYQSPGSPREGVGEIFSFSCRGCL